MRFIVLVGLAAFAGLAPGGADPTPAIDLAPAAVTAVTPGQGQDEWIFPGEFESHEAMWMLWPTYENKAGFLSTEVVSDLIDAMKGHVYVNLAVQDRVLQLHHAAAAGERRVCGSVPVGEGQGRGRARDRVEVRVSGETPLDGEVGWIDAAAIETAGEKCTPSGH